MIHYNLVLAIRRTAEPGSIQKSGFKLNPNQASATLGVGGGINSMSAI